jgi:hypothetical protein
VNGGYTVPKTIEEPQAQNLSEAIAVIKDWVTVDEFCSLFPNIPEKTIRWQLTTRQRNGLYRYVQVIGKQRYISIQGYANWLQENAEVTHD